MMTVMRVVVEIRREYEKLIAQEAARQHRTVREHAAYLIHKHLEQVESEQGEPEREVA